MHFGFAFVLMLTMAACNGSKETGPATNTPAPPVGEVKAPAPKPAPAHTEPQFNKEGRLALISEKGDTLAQVDIEIAATDSEREQGLMYRTTIAENTGMLFLFTESEPQSFWMRNTPSSLDILFIAPDGRILNMHEFTAPFSEKGLPSEGNADKVLELKAGYCQKYNIHPGDRIAYTMDGKVDVM